MRQVAGKWKWAVCLLMLSALFLVGNSRKVSAQPTDATSCRVVFANAKGVVSTSTYRNWCQVVEPGDWIKLPKFSQKGYKCYWVLKSGNTARKYYPGANYRITKNTKFCLYRYKLYNVRFMTANGRKEYLSQRQQDIKGQYITLPTIPSTGNYQIVGWKTSLNAKTYKKAGERVKVTGNMKFYPVVQRFSSYVTLRSSNGQIYTTVNTSSGTRAVFPSADVGNGDMVLGWSRTRGKTSQPEYYPGDAIPTKRGNYYMVVFSRSQDKAPAVLNQPLKHDMVYFVGDSRTMGMRKALGSSVPSNVKFVYRSGQGLTWFRKSGYSILLRNVANQPKRMKKAVVINLGANDLRNYSSYTKYMTQVAKKLKAYNCDMYYLSVNPVNSAMIKNRTGAVTKSEAEVKRFNNMIYSTLCTGRNKSFTYINTYSNLLKYGWISDRYNNGIYDGVHYSNETYLRIYDYCIRTLNR